MRSKVLLAPLPFQFVFQTIPVSEKLIEDWFVELGFSRGALLILGLQFAGSKPPSGFATEKRHNSFAYCVLDTVPVTNEEYVLYFCTVQKYLLSIARMNRTDSYTTVKKTLV